MTLGHEKNSSATPWWVVRKIIQKKKKKKEGGKQKNVEVPIFKLFQGWQKAAGDDNFITITRHYPRAIFDLIEEEKPETLPLAVRNNIENRARRRKRTIFGLAAQKHPEALLQMGLTQTDIDWIRENRTVPFYDQNRRYDLSLDHIIEIARGGSAGPENTVIVPYHINFVRSYLHHYQMSQPDLKTYLTLKYRESSDKPRLVPYIEGGFRDYDASAGTIRERLAPLFGGRVLKI